MFVFFASRLVDYLVCPLFGSLVDRMVNWLVGWLVSCLFVYFVDVVEWFTECVVVLFVVGCLGDVLIC